MAQGQGRTATVEAPDTLPPDFFDKKQEAPDTLPADFFEKQPEQPNALHRLAEVTIGFQHPIDELGRELHNVVHHPGQFAGDVSETIGIPREVWSDPSWKNLRRIGGTGIPGMVFGEHGLIAHPLEFGERITGANQAAEDVQSGNLKAIPGDIAGGIVNLALLRKPVERAGETAQAARRALTPIRTAPPRAPMGAYDPNVPPRSGAYTERLEPVQTPPSSSAEPGSRVEAAPRARLEPIGKRVGAIVNEAPGVKPLKADVPLREQLTRASAAEPAEIDPIKAKYPDPEIRQMVRANGEGIVEAAKGNPETLKAIHDLTRVDLRQALINAGEAMGQRTVSNSKFAGEGSIPREEAFNRLLEKGHGPEDIVRLAKQTPEARLEPVGSFARNTRTEKHIPERLTHVGGSGESSASMEAINRGAAERSAGVRYFIERPGGQRVPISSIDANGEMRLNPGSRIIRSTPQGESVYR